jgi:hypothetical protein
MKMSMVVALAAASCTLAACHKKPEPTSDAPAAASATTPAPTPAPAEQTYDDRQRLERKAQLEYATMEDGFLNDAKAQWAQGATVSSTFGDSRSNTSEVNKAQNIAGKPNGEFWTNDNQDMGFDWLEATFEKPVHATEVRAVFGDGVEGVSKLELKDAAGKYTTVWSGLNEDTPEKRGPRKWFIRKFDKTASAIVGVKITIANTVAQGYKTVDAVQLIGE